ncbi:MAG: methyl-accepting chemotaxis protein [bacterium]|nr:methyl-accepting chemotaxis protein [bacterium]
MKFDADNWSIAVKLGVPTLAIVAAAVFGLGLYSSWEARRNSLDYAVINAKATLERFKTIRAYYAENVVGKVKSNSDLKIHYDHKNSMDTIPLPATMIHDLSEILRESGQATTLSLYSEYPFPNRSYRELDQFGKDAIEFMKKSPDEIFTRIEYLDGQEQIRVAMADKLIAEECVICHNNHPETPKRDWRRGQVRGVLEVTTAVDDEMAVAMGANVLRTSFTIGFFSLLALGGLGFLILRSITNRLDAMDDSMSAAAEGNLTLDLRSSGRDEIAVIGNSLQDLIVGLRGSIGEVKTHGGVVVHASREMNGVAEELARATDRMSPQAESAVSRTSELEHHLAEVASMVEESSGSVRNVAAAIEQTSTNLTTIASNAKGVAADVAAAADAGNRVASSLGGVREKASEAAKMTEQASMSARETNQTVENLGVSANEIGAVVETINRIAEQTNLLALNATIEAASAGEAGRGFSVVANEVKELAKQTSEATTGIRQRVEEIQSSTEASVQAIVNTSATIDEINRISQGIADAVQGQASGMEEMVGLTTSAADAANMISRNVEEASSGAVEVAKNGEKLADGASQIARSASEASDAARGVASSLQTMQQEVTSTVTCSGRVSSASSELTDLAESLDQTVARFET